MKRTTLVAALAALLAGTAHAAVTELVIYKDANFQGPAQTIKGEVNNLEDGFGRSASSLIARGGAWEVCTGDHFKGTCRVVREGQYPTLGNLDERIVSVRFLGDNEERIAKRDDFRQWRQARDEDRREWRGDRRERRVAGGAVDLYGRPEFRGRSVRVEDDARDLAELRFDGRASSLIVHEGTWQLCTEPGYRGRCAVFEPGRYDQLASLDDRISSMRQLR